MNRLAQAAAIASNPTNLPIIGEPPKDEGPVRISLNIVENRVVLEINEPPQEGEETGRPIASFTGVADVVDADTKLMDYGPAVACAIGIIEQYVSQEAAFQTFTNITQRIRAKAQVAG